MKKLLLLFAVLLTTVGAWAQEVVTYINVNNVYKLHCIASAHAEDTPQGKYLADDADGNILGRSDEGTYFCFEKADGENQYYIKNVKTGKYINAEANSNAPVTTSTDKAIATVWTLGVPAHTQSIVTFGLPGDFYLNNNYALCDPIHELQLIHLLKNSYNLIIYMDVQYEFPCYIRHPSCCLSHIHLTSYYQKSIVTFLNKILPLVIKLLIQFLFHLQKKCLYRHLMD